MQEYNLGIEGELVRTEYQRNLQIALVGCGSHAFRNILPCLQYLPFNLIATCDLNELKAQKYAEKFGSGGYYTDYNTMLEKEDVEAVIAVLGYDDNGSPRYPSIVSDILKRGIPVWLEKPPAANSNELEIMINSAEKGSTFFQVGFKKMFMPINLKAKEIINSKDFGEISSYKMRYPVDLPKKGFNLFEPESRRFIDDFVHVASSIVHLIGTPEKIMYHRVRNGGGFATLYHKNNISGVVHFAKGASLLSPLERTEIIGTGENVIIDNNINMKHYKKGIIGSYGRETSFVPKSGRIEEYNVEFSLGQLYNKSLFIQGYYNELLEFYKSVINNDHPKKSGFKDSLNVMKIIDCFSGPENEFIYLGNNYKRVVQNNEPKYKICPNCNGNLILKDGWNYSCKKCGRSIDTNILDDNINL